MEDVVLDHEGTLIMSDEGVLPRNEHQLHMLDQISGLLVDSFDPPTMFAKLVRMLVPTLADVCVVFEQADDGTLVQGATAHASLEQETTWTALGTNGYTVLEQLAGWQRAMATAEPVIHAELSLEPWLNLARSTEELALLTTYAPYGACSIPLAVRGRTHGVLVLMTTASRRTYGPTTLAFLAKVVRHVAIFADNAYMFRAEQRAREAAERAAKRTTQLQTVAAAMGRALTRDEVAAHLVQQTVAAVGAETALVVARSEDGVNLELLGSFGYEPAIVAGWKRFPIDSGVPIGDAVLTGLPVWLGSPAEMEAAYPIFRGQGSVRIHQALGSIPLLSEGRSIGAIGLAFREPQQWDDQDQALVFAIAQLCAQALERARLYDAERQARIDAEQEIVRRRSAEAALVQSEQQLRLLTDALPVLIAYVDHDQRYRFNNKTYEAWFGLRREDLVGKHMSEVVSSDTYETLRPYIERVLRGEQLSFEGALPINDGSVRPIQVTYVPHISPTGKVLGYYALASDISARKRVEMAQRFLTEATSLLASSLDYETTLAHVGQLAVPRIADWCSINLLDEQGAFVRVAGVHVDPHKQALLDELREREPPSLNNDDMVTQSLRTAEPLLIREFTEAAYRAVAKNEAQYDVYREVGFQSAMILPLQSSERVLGLLILMISESGRRYSDDDLELAQNIANRAAVAIENARLFRQVQETVRIRDEFLSIAAHELKTPITSLSGYAQLLQARFVVDYTLKERDLRAIQVINGQVERLTKLIGAMLDVTRIESGHFALDLHPVNLSDLAVAAADELAPMLAAHSIDCAAVEPGIMIVGDEQRLEQAILNLLQNAIKYSPEGGQITVSLRRDNNWVVLAVTDQGIGIPTGARDSLFQLFYRASNVVGSSISGVGLGLYVVHEIVSRHNGTVDVVSEEGRGSTFTVRLPAA